MSLQDHVATLSTKHARLDERIRTENSRPMPDNTALARLKREKLKLKEELERLRVQIGAPSETRH